MPQRTDSQATDEECRCPVCLQEVDTVLSILKDTKSDSVREFRRIFEETSKLGVNLHGEDFDLRKPMINQRQRHRRKVPATTAEDYYRKTLYNDFLSDVITELQDRFTDNPSYRTGLLHLVPSQCPSTDGEIPEDLAKAVDFYEDDLPHSAMFPTRYRMWIRKWKNDIVSSAVPTKLVDALQACDQWTSPNIQVLLHLALTIPVTSCESERSFSQLKLLKTYRRSTMSADRLSGLALMKINRSKCEKIQKSQSQLIK